MSASRFAGKTERQMRVFLDTEFSLIRPLKNYCGGPSAVLRGAGSGRAAQSAAPM